MEDPWANAWGEPSKPAQSFQSTLTAANSSSWSAPSVSAIHGDREDDLATPSWSFEPDMAWKHEDSDVLQASVWNKDADTAVWNPLASTSGQPSSHKDSTTPPDTVHTKSEPSSRSTTPTADVDTEEQPPLIVPPIEPPKPPPVVTPLPLPISDDIDGFGTFETAEESVADPESAKWSPSPPTLSLASADSSGWGGAWADVPSSPRNPEQEQEEENDEWEAARRQKERLDRHVPPELLASILQQLESLSDELWPVPDGQDTSDNTRSSNDQLGLDVAMQRLVPEDLSLPLPTPFDKTFISKQLAESLKLTRHSPVTRRGPMAMFMASKGSTTWEASIKAKPIVTQEDTTPAGWKILDTDPAEVPVAPDTKKKVTGGLLSFFGRKGTISTAETSPRSASPTSMKGSSSPRASTDSARPGTPNISHKPSPSISSVVEPAKSSLSASSEPQPAFTLSYDASPVMEEPTPAPAPAPSAVSRFFGRFASQPSRRDTKDSIALSDHDIEFLSDVPTANDGDKESELDALSMMIKSPPLPSVLPQPLPPPPKPAAPSRTGFVHTLKPQKQPDDVFDLFGDFEDKPSLEPAPPLMVPPVPPVKNNTFQFNSISSNFPPPPATDKQPTSAWPSFDYPAMSATKAVPAGKKPFVAIMTSSRSSSTSSVPHLPFPKPPQSGSSNIGGNIPFIPPPPSSRSHTPLPIPAPSSHIIKEEDEDDFADFLSSPPPNNTMQSQSFGDFASVAAKPSLSNQDLFANMDDDFGLFASTSPPAPTPPAKSPPQIHAIHRSVTPSSSPSPPPSTTLTRKISRKADHSRTLSLLETAAARGNWLGPPSPLPEALQPPPSMDQNSTSLRKNGTNSSRSSTMASSNSMPAVFSSNGFGETAFNGTNLTGSAPKIAPLPPPVSNNSVLMPSSTQIKQSDWFSQAPLPSAPKPATSSTPSTQAGGLSAQDLSFFEGL